MQQVKVYVLKFADRRALQLQWVDPETGRKKTKSAKTANRKEAEDKASELQYELSRGLYHEADRSSWAAFREALERDYLADMSENGRKSYLVALDVLEQHINPTKLGDLTEARLDAFKRRLLEAEKSRHTVKSYLNRVRTILGWGVRRKYLRAVPTMPSVKVPDKRPRRIIAEQFEKVLEKAQRYPMMREVLLGLWHTGLRISELLALEWPDLDMQAKRIWIRAEVSKGHRDDWIPMPTSFLDVVESLPRTSKRVFATGVTYSGVRWRLTKCIEQAGVKGFTLHDIRRTFGSRYAPHVQAPVLQRLMRHRDLATTAKYYLNVDDALESAIDAVPNSLANSSPKEAVFSGE